MEFRKNLLAALLASATIMPMYGDNIDYVVNSSASLARKVKPVEGTVFCSPAEGFSVLTADKKQLRLSMIDKDGNIIHTVTKNK